MSGKQFRAPQEDGGLLADPPLTDWLPLIKRNQDRLANWNHNFQGIRATDLRQLARNETAAVSRAFHQTHGLDCPDFPQDRPWIGTGHQPELFHPGVWIKNIFASAFASRLQGAGLNLIVDNDTIKRAAIRVPTRSEPGSTLIELDEWAAEVPYEDHIVRDEEKFAQFGAKTLAALDGQVPDPIVQSYWPLAVQRSDIPQLGLRLAVARREWEGRHGWRNGEIRLGALCETEAFAWFACSLLAHLPRYWSVHNQALIRHRVEHKIRSKHHPTAALRRDGEDWLEAPFWVWRPSQPRRAGLLARSNGSTIALRISGEDQPFAELPLGPDADARRAVEQIRQLPERQIRLRTRALTTTLFARLFLVDLFIHGIGGAKYDEFGDRVAQEFYGFAPPEHATLSLTLRLLSGFDLKLPERLRVTERFQRDLVFNPDRHLDSSTRESEPIAESIQAKTQAIEGPTDQRAERVARYRAIRQANESMFGAVRQQWESVDAEVNQLKKALRKQETASSREFAFVLHSESKLTRVFRNLTQSP